MKTICKNIAFSLDGKCLLGSDCICEKNKLWLEDSAPEAQPIADHVHVKLDSGAVATVSPNASPELLGALNTMCEKAMQVPIADKEVPTFYCHEIDSRGKDVCAEQCDMCEGYDKSPGQLTKAELIEKLNTDISTQAIQIAGLLASNKEWGEKYEAVEREMLDYRKSINRLLDEPVNPGEAVEILTDVLSKYPSPTPTDKP